MIKPGKSISSDSDVDDHDNNNEKNNADNNNEADDMMKPGDINIDKDEREHDNAHSMEETSDERKDNDNNEADDIIKARTSTDTRTKATMKTMTKKENHLLKRKRMI
jgi:hypothetical protein